MVMSGWTSTRPIRKAWWAASFPLPRGRPRWAGSTDPVLSARLRSLTAQLALTRKCRAASRRNRRLRHPPPDSIFTHDALAISSLFVDRPNGRMDDVADPRVRPVRSCDNQHLRRHGIGEPPLETGEEIRRVALRVNEDAMGQAASLERGRKAPLKIAE